MCQPLAGNENLIRLPRFQYYASPTSMCRTLRGACKTTFSRQCSTQSSSLSPSASHAAMQVDDLTVQSIQVFTVNFYDGLPSPTCLPSSTGQKQARPVAVRTPLRPEIRSDADPPWPATPRGPIPAHRHETLQSRLRGARATVSSTRLHVWRQQTPPVRIATAAGLTGV